MKRRDFMAGLGSAAAWPMTARATSDPWESQLNTLTRLTWAPS
jgi:hypothetical protein